METHEVEGVGGVTYQECVTSFLAQYYGSAPFIPKLILVDEVVEDESLLQFLTGQRGSNVEIRKPQRGDAKSLLERAQQTAQTALSQQKVIDDYDTERTAAILEDLANNLGLAAPPLRIECYDISNTMGTNSFGSMPSISGALVGGASLKAQEFAAIVAAAR